MVYIFTQLSLNPPSRRTAVERASAAEPAYGWVPASVPVTDTTGWSIEHSRLSRPQEFVRIYLEAAFYLPNRGILWYTLLLSQCRFFQVSKEQSSERAHRPVRGPISQERILRLGL